MLGKTCLGCRKKLGMARTKQSVIDANKARNVMEQPAAGGIKKRTTRLTKMEEKLSNLQKKLDEKQNELDATKKRVHQKEERKALLKRVRAQLDKVTLSDDFIKLCEFYSDGISLNLRSDFKNTLSTHHQYGSEGKGWFREHFLHDDESVYTDSECETLEDWETDVSSSSSTSSSDDDDDSDSDTSY